MNDGENLSLPPRFFQREDWLSFGLTALVALAIYLLTLAPDVGLEFEGQYTTGAAYGGVPITPGYPVWVMYSWVFTKLLPFSNLACRLAAGSAVAGALTGGIIALMVSRGGALLLGGTGGPGRLAPREEKWLRAVCGGVAGMGFCLDSAFWRHAVTADTWPLDVLLFAVVLCLLMRWMAAPGRRRCLIAATFVCGLAVIDNQLFLLGILSLQLFVAFVKPELGRDIFFADLVLGLAGVVARHFSLVQPLVAYVETVGGLYALVMICAAVLCAVFCLVTGRIFTEWKSVLFLAAAFCLGLMVYFYVPIASMTNPPMNWGYPRTVDGFLHVLTRGQFESPSPTYDVRRFIDELGIYYRLLSEDFGICYLLPAVIPFGFLFRTGKAGRVWLLGLLAIYLFTAFFVLDVVNPAPDRASTDLERIFFTPSCLLLAVFAGCGLILFGNLAARPAGKARNYFPPTPVSTPPSPHLPAGSGS
jgi:hypothetical protein